MALGRAASSGQQPEALAERIGDLTDGQCLRSCCRQLDRERQPVESLADVQDVRLLGLARREPGTNGAGPFDEQLAGGAVLERLDGTHVLAADGQALAARGQHRHGRRRRHDALDQRRRGVDHVLAVVEHQEHAPPAQRLDEPRLEWDLGPRLDAERGGDRGDDLVAAPHGRQLAERDMIEPVEIARPIMPDSPWPDSLATMCASSTARRVLPTPPGPVMVTVLAMPRIPRSSPTSRSRPMSRVAGWGRIDAVEPTTSCRVRGTSSVWSSIDRSRSRSAGTDRARARRRGGGGGPGRPAAPRAGDRRGTARSSAAPGSGRATGVPRRD